MKILEISNPALPAANRETTPKAISYWEYVVDDFLEIGCYLTEEKRQLLLEELRLQGCAAEAIEMRPSFSIDNRLIVIIEDSRMEECWLYYPNHQKIERYLFKKKK